MQNFENYYNSRWTREHASATPADITRTRTVAQVTASELPPSNAKILDVGCGNGWVIEALSRSTSDKLKMYGLEPSSQGVANASARNPEATIKQGTLRDVTFNTLFDAVITSEVIEHVTDKESFLTQIAAILKPNGLMILTTPNGRFRKTYFQNTPSATPQPVEEWLSIQTLNQMCDLHFESKSLRTISPEYYYSQHWLLASARAVVNKLPAGRHLRSRIDRFVCRHLAQGLTIVAVYKKRDTDESTVREAA